MHLLNRTTHRKISNYTGNLLTLMRQGPVTPKTYGTVDNITATYQGNQIASLRDDAPTVLLESSLDMPSGAWSGSDFAYDRNGNQTRDLSRGVNDITYNELNLPAHVEMEGGGAIEYLYTAAGTKLAEIVKDEDDNILIRRDYAGMIEYEADSIVRIALTSGYVTVADTVFHLLVPDYQGNIVAVYNTSSGRQEHYKDYYPYGLPHAQMPVSTTTIIPGLNPGFGSGFGSIITNPTEPEETSSTNRKWFSTKELTTDHSLNTYDFEARVMTPAFPRFTSPDPLATDYTPISPYNFCASDPINLIDPTGMDIYHVNPMGYVVEKKSNTKKDAIVMVDNDNNPIEGAYLEYNYGTIYCDDTKEIKGEGNLKYNVFSVLDEKAAKEIFELFANKTKVEWSNAYLIDHEGEKYNVLTTSHEKYKERGFPNYINYWDKPEREENQIVSIKYLIHNHPSNIPIPSGLSDHSGDIGLAIELDNIIKKPINYAVYSAKFNTYVGYRSTSKPSDYIMLHFSFLLLNEKFFSFIYE